MLRGQLPAGAGGHADDQRDAELSARHVPDRRRVVDDLIERQQAEVDRHHLDDRPHAAERGADAGADERRLRERRVANPLGSELGEQSLAHGVRSAVLPDVLAHQEDARILRERFPERGPNGFAVRRRHHATPVRAARRGSAGV